MFDTATKLCLIVGDPVAHSLSPLIHNVAYKALGIQDRYVYLASHVKEEDVEAAVKGFRALGIRGVSVTIPHKFAVMDYLDDITASAKEIGAVNTIVNDNGFLVGYNTDYLGILNPLKELTTLNNKKVAIIGAGGAAYSAAYALKEAGAEVLIINRTIEKAQLLANKFDCEAEDLDKISMVAESDIIINCTAVGIKPGEPSVVPEEFLHDKQIVFDTNYSEKETGLLKAASEKGAKTIHGIEMLIGQGVVQFELFTDQQAPISEIRKACYQHFGWEK